ncbi:hypothetical protein HSX44_03685 [Wolbachia endosymbiont of Onchocerca gibsoni]|nr:hypothetical protein [Wolbachia endosymbiont of Onchocerca gibsoni]MDF0607954.1 hypothetical protein [Wolbachia endosymbiont of Onchocerca gibsoni]
MSDVVLHTRTRPEIDVASTKTLSAQLTVLVLACFVLEFTKIKGTFK